MLISLLIEKQKIEALTILMGLLDKSSSEIPDTIRDDLIRMLSWTAFHPSKSAITEIISSGDLRNYTKPNIKERSLRPKLEIMLSWKTEGSI